MTELNPLFVPGDVIVQREQDGNWRAVRILERDPFPDGDATLHCLIFVKTADKPDLAMLGELKISSMHAPIAGSAFIGWERIGHRPVGREECEGFIEYLKHADFPRYLQVTEQEVETVVAAANAHYRRACQLGDEGCRHEAIAEYDAAVDLFPLFYEAIDNRAFTLMELGDYRAALLGFQDSLQVNPDGIAAFFSKGECLLRLGDFAAAELVFVAGRERFPPGSAPFDKFLDLARRKINPSQK
jgi:tetratricopeptide (TPR) repeat protein